jgi:hypothetical protein
VSTGNDNTPHLLSCGHVLDGHDSEEPLVISQGLVVAKVSKQDQLLPDGFSNPSQTDSSRASLLQGVLTSRDLPDGRGPLGSPEPLKAELGMTVWKVGRNVSVGTVMDTGADVRVDFDALTTVLKNQILVQGSGAPFAQPGDSGALVIAEFGGQRRAVGMICAAGGGSATAMVVPSSQPNWAAVTPMQNVLERLSATLLI